MRGKVPDAFSYYILLLIFIQISHFWNHRRIRASGNDSLLYSVDSYRIDNIVSSVHAVNMLNLNNLVAGFNFGDEVEKIVDSETGGSRYDDLSLLSLSFIQHPQGITRLNRRQIIRWQIQ